MDSLAILDRAAARLMQKTPEETNQSLAALLTQQTGLSIVSNSKNVFHDNRTVTEDYRPPTLRGDCEPDKILPVIKAYELAMTPAPEKEIVKAISKLRVMTESRAADHVDFQLLLQTWAENLVQYPADIVIVALKPRGKWFPAYHDIAEYCKDETRRRADIIKELKSWHRYGNHKNRALGVDKKPSKDERVKRLAILEKLKQELVQSSNPYKKEVA